jgi:branched-chain amino acid transport system substrate-binding protein
VNSAVALGGANVVTEAGKLFLISNAGANALTGEAGNELIWRTSYTNSQRGFPAGEYLASLDEVKDGVFVIAADYAAGHEDIAGFRQAFEAGGGTIVGEVYTPFGTTDDFQPYLSQIRQSGAKAVYAFYAGAETVAFIRQYNEFGLKDEIPLYGAGVITEAVLPALGEAALGIKTVWHYSSELETPENQEFRSAYVAEYDALPSVFSAQTWDAATVLDLALRESGGDVSGQALAQALESLGPIPSPRGEWSFEGRNPNHPVYLREVRQVDGQFVNVVLDELGRYAQPDIGS